MIERLIASERGVLLFKATNNNTWHANPYYAALRLNNEQLIHAVAVETAAREKEKVTVHTSDIELAYSSSRSIVKKVLERECKLRGLNAPQLENQDNPIL